MPPSINRCLPIKCRLIIYQFLPSLFGLFFPRHRSLRCVALFLSVKYCYYCDYDSMKEDGKPRISHPLIHIQPQIHLMMAKFWS